MTFINSKEWYAYNANFGTIEEKNLTYLIDRKIEDLYKNFSEVYLIRNEQFFPIYDFEQGRPFYPDFVLFLMNNKEKIETYQIFVEPKGEHIAPKDKWKEDFLKSIKKKYKRTEEIPLGEYNIIGIPFYESKKEKDFELELFESICSNYE